MIDLLHKNTSSAVSQFYVRYILGIWLLMILVDPITDLALLDPRLLTLRGIPLSFFPESVKPLLLNSAFLGIFKVSMLLCIISRLFNMFPRASMTLAAVLITVHQALVRGFGYSNHAELGILIALYSILIHDLSSSKIKRRDTAVNINGLPIIMMLLMVSVAYMLIGMRRVVYGQFEIFTSDTILQYSMRNANQWGSTLARSCLAFVLQYDWLKVIVKGGFFITTVFEVLAPLALIVKPFRYMFIVVMLGFHLMCWLLMDILFWQNVLLFIFFFDLTYWFKRWGWDRS